MTNKKKVKIEKSKYKFLNNNMTPSLFTHKKYNYHKVSLIAETNEKQKLINSFSTKLVEIEKRQQSRKVIHCKIGSRVVVCVC